MSDIRHKTLAALTSGDILSRNAHKLGYLGLLITNLACFELVSHITGDPEIFTQRCDGKCHTYNDLSAVASLGSCLTGYKLLKVTAQVDT